MSDFLIFEAIVIKVEGNKICKVYLKDDDTKTPIIGYIRESMTSKKSQRVRTGDTVMVRFSGSDKERCLVMNKVNNKPLGENEVKKNNNRQQKKKNYK